VTTANCLSIGLLLSVVLLFLGTKDTAKYFEQWKITTATTTGSHFQQQDLRIDGCDLIDSTSSYIPQWRNYTEEEAEEVQSLRQCIWALGEIPNMTFIPNMLTLRPQHQMEESKKLDCNIKVSLQILQDTMKQYDTAWFFGDSIMQQQFYLMVCMIDPHLGINITRATDNPQEDLSFAWHHSNNNSTRTTTTLKFLHFGHLWGIEENLYERDFPTAANTLGSNDAIIVTAAAHYDSTRVHLYQKALTHIATMSIQSNASIFYTEPTPEEWPTGNGMWVLNCQWFCQCEALDPARLIGRGGYTDRTVPYDATSKQNVSIVPILNRVYPGLPFANNTKDCYPSCLPATWRTDVGRAILAEIPNHKVSMIPVFWQLLAKGEATGRGVHQPNVGDCTHRTTEAVIVMNKQLIRTMIKRQQQKLI
jgi:hypothetical protein